MPTKTTILKILAETRILVTFFTALTLLYLRTFASVYFVFGAVLCSLIGKILKNIIRQSRPLPVQNISQTRGYGMPSTHAQTMSFFMAYLSLSLFDLSNPLTILLVPLGLFTFFVIWSRVQLGHHTIAQVGVGTTIGILLAIVWWSLWQERVGPCVRGKEREIIIEWVGIPEPLVDWIFSQ